MVKRKNRLPLNAKVSIEMTAGRPFIKRGALVQLVYIKYIAQALSEDMTLFQSWGNPEMPPSAN